jgi:hypothetical protein
MVHRTDIAGGSLGQVSPDDDRVCRAPKWRPSRKQSSARTAARFSAARFNWRHEGLLSARDGSPAVDAIHFELTTP